MLVIYEVLEKILAYIVWLIKERKLGAIFFVTVVLSLAVFYVIELINLLTH